MSIVRRFQVRFATTAVLLVALLAALTACGPQPSVGWDTDPDKLTEQIAESMRDLLIEGNFAPLANGQPLPTERRMALEEGRWPGTGTLFAWYRGVASFAELESCIKKGLPFFAPCRQETYAKAWWIVGDKLGEAAPSEWEWILGVKLEKYNLSYAILITVLNEQGDKALAYVDYHCPGNCGGGTLYTLERRENGWYVLESKPVWKTK
jgi:hypothetical protein